ncbi:unnamed protein product (macronuclear) [Paramecium tetraurelia]|uniref:Uncharacterized protein n=1 Tax=Paramecium tetraurelia TaxID=5888 RepID=A0DN86_PARTE|nr:uncharacterized protein GSPATT00018708001 [Paramecium tetraurelia]CAK84503.1 unnamed protein product [Paramecium tetraurelia]|eukprot:XP_001451900.1 hypothetical protein (macronuclear) [Paramecium tetraurelia strain d4-2]
MVETRNIHPMLKLEADLGFETSSHPIRDHFAKVPEARAFLQEIRSYQVTR